MARFSMVSVLLLGVLVAPFVTGVGQEQPRYGGTLVVMCNPAEVRTLDPLRSSITDAETGSVIMQIHRGLAIWTPELSVEPALAESWEVSEDGMVYTFHLRHGAKFHNGREVVAQDCKYSFERLMNPENAGISIYIFKNVVGVDEFRKGEADHISGIKVLDRYTLQITLRSRDAVFLEKLAEPGAAVVPHEVVEELGNEQFARHPVGAGPFKFVSWVGDTITLEAFDDYYDGRPYLDTLVFRRLTDYTAAKFAFDREEIDLTWINPVTYPNWKKDPKFRELSVAELWLRHIGFNNEWGPFKDKRVRQALNYAIDRETYVKVHLGGVAIPATGLGIFPPGYGLPVEDVPSYSYNPEKARELLAEAGYPDGFTFSVIGEPNDPAWGAPAVEPLLGYFEAIGVHCKIVPMEYGTVVANVLAGNFEAYVDSHGGESTPLQYALRFHSSQIGEINWCRYRNPEVDALIDEAYKTVDNTKRRELLAKVQEIVADDAPMLMLNFSEVIFARQQWVHGLQKMPIDLKYQRYEWVWVDESSPRA